MEVDIRLAIGFMFSLLGLILSVFGLFTGADAALYSRSFGININLLSGLFMLAFGGLMLIFGFRSRRKKSHSDV